MAVYVDEPVFSNPRKGFYNWCHMTSDSLDELHAFAQKLGLKRSYFQPGKNPAGLLAHYDLSPAKRALAVKLGAQEVHAMDRARQLLDKMQQQPAQPLLFGGVEASIVAGLQWLGKEQEP